MAVPVHKSPRELTTITIGRAAAPVAGGALPVMAKAGAQSKTPKMTERTRGMPGDDNT
jgi:hypothetical protein